jgi:chromosome segregation ATPase
MSNLIENIEVVQVWINELRQKQTTDPAVLSTAEPVLTEIMGLIRQGRTHSSAQQGMSETYADLERQIQEQTTALNKATSALKSQIAERETAAIKLRKAYNDLEMHLQEHIADHSRLNQRLQEQIEEQKRSRAL